MNNYLPKFKQINPMFKAKKNVFNSSLWIVKAKKIIVRDQQLSCMIGATN